MCKKRPTFFLLVIYFLFSLCLACEGGSKKRTTTPGKTSTTTTTDTTTSTSTTTNTSIIGGNTSCADSSQAIGAVESILVEDKVSHTSLHNVGKYLLANNSNGIFFSYAPRRYETDLEGGQVIVEGSNTIWRLMRVNSDCKGFTKIFEETCRMCNAPAIESDIQGNLYLVTGDPDDSTWIITGPRDARLFKFEVAKNYESPTIYKIPQGNSDKYRLAFDRSSQKLYYYTYNSQLKNDFIRVIKSFFVLNLDGSVANSIALNKEGDTARIMYPHLAVENSKIVAIWQTEKNNEETLRLYRNISFVYSDDQGNSWKNFSGTAMSYPLVNDNTGPGTMVTFPKDHPSNEEGDHNWLGDAILKNRKLHILYQIWGVMHPGSRTHYSRFNFETGARDIDLQPDLQGVAGNGHFVTDPNDASSPIYIVSTKSNSSGGQVLAVLVSRDEGKTWTSLGEGVVYFGDPTALDTIQTLHNITPDGYLVGLYSRCNARPSLGRCGSYVGGQFIYDSRTYFFKVKVK